jgi:hypothetical protein
MLTASLRLASDLTQRQIVALARFPESGAERKVREKMVREKKAW